MALSKDDILNAVAELTVVELAPLPDTGAASAIGDSSIAGVTGALAGVR